LQLCCGFTTGTRQFDAHQSDIKAKAASGGPLNHPMSARLEHSRQLSLLLMSLPGRIFSAAN
jgi:hypothetical protein